MIVVLGAFDGYHLGHQRLFSVASAMAERESCGWAVVSFTPHPKTVLMHERVSLLFTEEEKVLLREILSIPTMIQFPFTSRLSSMDPEDFFSYMDKEIGVSGVVVGDNFRFGRERRGDVDTLSEICRGKGIPFSSVLPVTIDGSVVSSTSIRDLISMGKISEASTRLGYPFFMRGHVIEGSRRGRKIGVPTANLSFPSTKIIPKPGVYAGAAYLDGEWCPAAISIGNNPTFGDISENRVEVHIIDKNEDLYDQTLYVLFFERLRSERRFLDPERLVSQLKDDIKRTKGIFGCKTDLLSPFYTSSVLNCMMYRGTIPFVPGAGL
ncbi:riboflavin biosynthesis protein RibF [Dethiosulfovibrio peptidovorans DSM 11002]|uniref:Riboflavin biosynthesis protein n=1 Tax=Dethiosulfovibrio peptidovorans DSM 11002 TaxID=469381 RepID=D2Z3W2_9BACT|nr:riboflavin biosynthesis protein RibF [Dethiosulfovibrio peptidovorans]EFC92223.1 riboflavin biosynthesis protein RibF [Dethiosulfovibrio peptidovorans DSM 11002]